MSERLSCHLPMHTWSNVYNFPIKDHFGSKYYIKAPYLDGVLKFKAGYNLSPIAVVPVLTKMDHFYFTSACRVQADEAVVPMRWGILPHLDSDEIIHNPTTRVETLTIGNTYRPEYDLNKRCVVLCNGYYEWPGSGQQPYYIRPQRILNPQPDYYPYGQFPIECGLDPVLALAGLFNIKCYRTGMMYSATVLTTKAEEKLAWLNPRMPIVLDSRKDLHSWLNYDTLYGQNGIDFIQNHKKKESNYVLDYYPVDRKIVNNRACQSVACIERLNLKRKAPPHW